MAIVIFSCVLSIILHGITSGYTNVPQNANWSVFIKILGFTPAITLYFLMAFGIIAYVFYMYEDKLPGIKSVKGLRYGIAIGLLWFWGMLEGVSLSGNPLINELVTGICDAVPIVIMGLLLGKFATKSKSNENKSHDPDYMFFSALIFATVFLVGRYLFYYTNIIKSGYETYPQFTFIWTLLMGVCIGVTYLLLGQTVQSSSPRSGALKFGISIFGINWAVFIVLVPFIFEGTLIDSILRIMLDTSLVILSCYISETIKKLNFQKKYNINVNKYDN